MRKLLKRVFSMAVVAALGMSMAFTSFAETAPTVQLPVTIDLSGKVPSKAEEYTVILTAKKNVYPMPEGSVDGRYELKILGEGTEELGPIIYTKLGVYEYTIHQIAGVNSKGTYDSKVYDVTVYVTNDEDNGGFKVTLAVSSGNEADKYDSIKFTNSYSGGGGSSGGGNSGGGSDGGSSGGTGDGLTVISDQDTPLAQIIPDPQIPLAALPKTGDTTNIALWLALMAASGLGLVVLMTAKKKMEA